MIELAENYEIGAALLVFIAGVLVGCIVQEKSTLREYGLDKKSQEQKRELLKDAPEDLKYKLVVVMHNKERGWLGGRVKCDICSHNWHAVFHESTDKLECPNCEQMVNFELIEIAE